MAESRQFTVVLSQDAAEGLIRGLRRAVRNTKRTGGLYWAGIDAPGAGLLIGVQRCSGHDVTVIRVTSGAVRMADGGAAWRWN